MSTVATDQLLTVTEVAEQLQMTTAGVYKLIQRGKLDAVRLSARKTRIPAASLARYTAATQAWVDRYLASQPTGDLELLRSDFANETSLSPEDWVASWKRNELADTAENMQLLARAAALHKAPSQLARNPAATASPRH